MLSFLRQDAEHVHELVVIANLTPVPRLQYRVGLPRPGRWRELLNSDAAVYGGSNMGNGGGVTATDKPCHNLPCSAEFILPPLSILVFRPERAADLVVASPEPASEKAPEVLQSADPVASASAAVAAPAKPAPDSGKAFHRIPDSVLKALDAVASAPAGAGSAGSTGAVHDPVPETQKPQTS